MLVAGPAPDFRTSGWLWGAAVAVLRRSREMTHPCSPKVDHPLGPDSAISAPSEVSWRAAGPRGGERPRRSVKGLMRLRRG